MKVLSVLISVFLLLTLAHSPAEAEVKKKKKIIYKKKTKVSFSDAVIEGSIRNPEGVYVVPPPPQRSPDLLKIRPNFHKELMRDALLIK